MLHCDQQASSIVRTAADVIYPISSYQYKEPKSPDGSFHYWTLSRASTEWRSPIFAADVEPKLLAIESNNSAASVAGLYIQKLRRAPVRLLSLKISLVKALVSNMLFWIWVLKVSPVKVVPLIIRWRFPTARPLTKPQWPDPYNDSKCFLVKTNAQERPRNQNKRLL